MLQGGYVGHHGGPPQPLRDRVKLLLDQGEGVHRPQLLPALHHPLQCTKGLRSGGEAARTGDNGSLSK